MAKRYELSDEAWTVVADLFTETHGRGRSRLNDHLMLDGVLWVLCSGCVARYVGTLRPMVNGVSTAPGLAKPRHI
jgi:transposase